jgi:hypothetical protein
MKTLMIVIAAIAVAVSFTACKEKTASEKAADSVKEAADKTGKAVKEGAEKTADAVKDATK